MNTSTPALAQCRFCLTINPFDAEDPDRPCPNCGVVPKRLPDPPPADGALVDLDEDATGDEAMSPVQGRQKLPVMTLALISVLAVVVSLGVTGAVGYSLWSAVGGALPVADDAVAHQAPELSAELDGWETTPVWTSPVAADVATESEDGKWLGVIADDTAIILDAETGEPVATQPMGSDTTSQVYRTGDMLIAADSDTTYIWAGDATRQGDAAEDASGATGWRQVDLPREATQTRRGAVAFLVTEVGATYDIIKSDATLTAVDVPTVGAVPVAATGDTITWGTNKGVVYVTEHDGGDGSDATLETPADDATISRWLGGDAAHVYVAWESDATLDVAVHDVATGALVSTSPIKELGTATLVTTRDGSVASVAGLLINTTTGAITPLEDGDANATVGGDIRVSQKSGAVLVDDAGAVQLEAPMDATPVAVTSDGNLVVTNDGALVALPPSLKESVRD